MRVRELLAAHNDTLRARGLSPASLPNNDPSLDAVPAKGERREIPGRMNLSAGGTMVLAEAPSEKALALARQAARATGLRVAAIDMFVDIGGKPDAITTRSGASPTRAIGAKSLTGSKGTFRMIWRAITWV